MEPHLKYLNKYCSLRKFICCGRLNPRTGGVIIYNAKDKDGVEALKDGSILYG